jgi:ubiquinone biosynthesis protein
MRFSKIPLAVNELGRAREIIGVVVKYGFNDWVSNNGLGRFLVTKKHKARIDSLTKWERARMAIEELGPTFVKFGQIMADRIDIVPQELRDELSKLQDEADPIPDDLAIREVEKQLKRPLDEVFREFDRKRLASASLAQTYRAVLLNGKEVCIKIQRPGIEKKINLDLQLMHYFAARIQRNNPEWEAINVVGLVKEFGKTIMKELDFRHEAANVVRFRNNFRDDPEIFVPAVFMEFTTPRMLVEEFVNGVKASDAEALAAKGFDKVALARRAGRLVFEQIFTHGFFHADPHFGNIFILDNGVISFLDYGMMGSLRTEHMHFLGKYVLGYLGRDPHEITEALLLLSGKRSFAQSRELEFQIAEMLAHYKYLSIHEMDFGRVMNESIDIIVRFGLRIPPSIYLLIKALITIERVAVTLYPEVDLAQEMEPYAARLLAEQFSPKHIAKEVFDALKDYYKLITELPSELNEIIYKIKEGKFRTQIDLKGFEPLTEHIDMASNRVSIAIVLAALIIGASILSQWQDVRWIGAVVFMIAGLFAFWLLIRLFRRNKF